MDAKHPDTSSRPRTPPAPPGDRLVPVWDLPIRLFHWLTVLLVAGAYVTVRLNLFDLHVRIGEALLVLVIFRVLWGCLGSETARFRSFVASPAAAFRHLRHLSSREPDLQVGHNAAGAWMVLALIALLLIETLSGLYINNEIADQGPLSIWVPAWLANAISDLHAFGWDLLLAAVALHLIAIATYTLLKGHHLVRPMLTGRKQLPTEVRAPEQAPIGRALLLLIGAFIIVVLLVTYL